MGKKFVGDNFFMNPALKKKNLFDTYKEIDVYLDGMGRFHAVVGKMIVFETTFYRTKQKIDKLLNQK